ncbi:hypothetical protein G9A89_009225 [Geosiphon pyriformis]|nr:hypothetical protein G9A89_009225 [Geosiphon pyriformis]
MACKILSKVLSDKISIVCSAFNVLHKDNFLVLKDMTIQFLIFTIGSVIEDVLEKNQELWLVLQDMQKAYNSVKRQESVCGYRLNSHFVSKSGCPESQAGLFFFFAAGAFVDDTIWVGSMVILINSRVSSPSLSISGLPISIAKKGEFYQYLDIFLSTEGLSRPSLVKAHLNTVSNKQFLYLVLAVLQPIVNALIHKSLKLKSGLSLNFPSNMLYHSSFYSLKFFLQVQSEYKVAFLVSFVNFGGILGHLFVHRSHDLQVWCWYPVHLLSSPVRIHVSASNNFLAGMIYILLDCNLFLGSSLANSFWSCSSIFMSSILGELMFSRFLSSLWRFSFKLAMIFLNSVNSPSAGSLASNSAVSLNILDSNDFVSICDCLSRVGSSDISVYTDRSLKNLGTTGCRAGAAAFFENIGLGLGVGVSDLMSSTLTELQTIALALECVPTSNSVQLFLDSQSVLDAYKSELSLVCPDFHN